MRKAKVLNAVLFFAVALASPLSIADDAAVGAMANIMIKLNHFPSDADKERLSEIVESFRMFGTVFDVLGCNFPESDSEGFCLCEFLAAGSEQLPGRTEP